MQSRYETHCTFSVRLVYPKYESLIFLTIGLISSQLKQPLEMTSKKVVTMTENDLTIRIFGLSGDTIAEYAISSTNCAVCKVGIGERCTKASGNRTVCVGRFKYAISVLDAAAVRAVLGELDTIGASPVKPEAVSTAHDKNLTTRLCPGCLAYPKRTKAVLDEHYGFDTSEVAS